MDIRTRDEILMDEKVNQIDDVNIDKLFDTDSIIIPSLSEEVQHENLDAIDSAFSMEVQPNEFLDNLEFSHDDALPAKKEKTKLSISNKLLFFSLTSIAMLLSILFIYNLFVLGSLDRQVAAIRSTPASVSTVATYVPENDYISFDNGSHVAIVEREQTSSSPAQTNWFNSLCDDLSQWFGGKN